jgi:hypothetical protein
MGVTLQYSREIATFETLVRARLGRVRVDILHVDSPHAFVDSSNYESFRVWGEIQDEADHSEDDYISVSLWQAVY